MTPKVLFIGSIGAVAETSEYQRRAYNQAMSENSVNWEWTPELYKDLLQTNGGKNRLKLLSTATNQEMSDELIQKIHARKTELAGQMIVEDQVKPRPGLVNLIKSAKEAGTKVAWVTSTYEENTNAILDAAGSELSADDFDHIFHKKDTSEGKPSPAIYQTALQHYGVEPSECVAIEDSVISLLSAKGAGIKTVANLGAYHDEHVDNIADVVLDSYEDTNWSTLVNNIQKQ